MCFTSHKTGIKIWQNNKIIFLILRLAGERERWNVPYLKSTVLLFTDILHNFKYTLNPKSYIIKQKLKQILRFFHLIIFQLTELANYWFVAGIVWSISYNILILDVAINCSWNRCCFQLIFLVIWLSPISFLCLVLRKKPTHTPYPSHICRLLWSSFSMLPIENRDETPLNASNEVKKVLKCDYNYLKKIFCEFSQWFPHLFILIDFSKCSRNTT